MVSEYKTQLIWEIDEYCSYLQSNANVQPSRRILTLILLIHNTE